MMAKLAKTTKLPKVKSWSRGNYNFIVDYGIYYLACWSSLRSHSTHFTLARYGMSMSWRIFGYTSRRRRRFVLRYIDELKWVILLNCRCCCVPNKVLGRRSIIVNFLESASLTL